VQVVAFPECCFVGKLRIFSRQDILIPACRYLCRICSGLLLKARFTDTVDARSTQHWPLLFRPDRNAYCNFLLHLERALDLL